MLLSNNKEPRVKSFSEAVGAEYIFKAGKPAVKNYRRAMERLGTYEENTLFVGDQLFTDIWGAKKAGIRTFLVKPIHPKEEIQIVLKRVLEKIVLFFICAGENERFEDWQKKNFENIPAKGGGCHAGDRRAYEAVRIDR